MENDQNDDVKAGKVTRRFFLESISIGALSVAAIGGILLSGEYLSPNVVREPPTRFKAGHPDEYSPGSVTFNKEQRVFIVRAPEGNFYALSAVCTHLGCIVNWKPDEGIIACPCHGSKFNKDGTKIEGPAPRPLQRLSMSLDDHGYLVVDKSVIVGEEFTLKV